MTSACNAVFVWHYENTLLQCTQTIALKTLPREIDRNSSYLGEVMPTFA